MENTMPTAEMVRAWNDETARGGKGTADHPAGDLDAELEQLFALTVGALPETIGHTCITLCAHSYCCY
jgi:hypothetical protein